MRWRKRRSLGYGDEARRQAEFELEMARRHVAAVEEDLEIMDEVVDPESELNRDLAEARRAYAAGELEHEKLPREWTELARGDQPGRRPSV
jgi:hypothetical protein